MKKFKGKRVLVYGLGTSGQAACKLLHEFGACVSVYDEDRAWRTLFCYDAEPLMHSYDLVVVSPGIKVIGNSLISGFRAKKTPIISELDLGSMFCLGKIIALTGTNGKTTTCSLLGKIFESAGKNTFVCGNIGLPISSIANKTDKKSVIVCEVSNFQLELSCTFAPDIACVLNIAPDHIDRHESFDEYKRVKSQIFTRLKKQAVINADDKGACALPLPKKTIFYSLYPATKGVNVRGGCIYIGKNRLINIDEVPLLGEKNISNVVAAVTIAHLCHIKPRAIKNAIMSFSPPPHRLEYVCEKDGVRYINDSKSTNIACTNMAIESLNCDGLILLMGGQNKGLVFDDFFASKPKIKSVIAFGEAGQTIMESAKKSGFYCQVAPTMEKAVEISKSISKQGDTVLLSPACASFDEFASYSARGQIFKELVSQ